MRNVNSAFKSISGQERFESAYKNALQLWPIPYESVLVPTDYGQTHVLISGPKDSPAIVLLHGITAGSTMWYPNIKELSENYRTYCVDIPGDFNRSEVGKAIAKREDIVDWLNQVSRGLRLDQFDLIGHSMGGFIALCYALHQPERIRKLVLLAPVASIHKLPLKFMLKVYPAMLKSSKKRIHKAWQWFAAKGSDIDTLISPVYYKQLEEGFFHGSLKLKVIPTVFTDAELKSLTSPTLLLVGDEEVIYPAQKVMNRMTSLNHYVTAEIISNSSHLLTIEQHEIVNKKIVQFLNCTI